MAIKKIPTGISGLDMMLNGGLIEGRPYSVVGGPGSGKSILSWQFLTEGAEKGEVCLYITLDEPHDEIRDNMNSIGIQNNNIRIMDLSPGGLEEKGDVSALDFMDKELPMQLKRLKPRRVVLDSTTSIRALESDPVRSRRSILSLMKTLSTPPAPGERPMTSLMVTEDHHDKNPLESYLSRGVIRLHNRLIKGSRVRAIGIEKMRGTSFDENLRPMKISEGGVMVAESDSMIVEL